MKDPTDGHMVELLTKDQLDQSARHRWTCPVEHRGDRCELRVDYLISYWHTVADVRTQQRTRVCGEHAASFAKRHAVVVKQPDSDSSPGPAPVRQVVRWAPALPPQPVVVMSQPLERRVSGAVPATVASRNVPDDAVWKVAQR